MKDGKYKEGEAILRLKIDMKNNNHSLRDPVAYRIKFTPHYRTGNQWCIYPSYDYSHAIIDSLEGITDSFCTMEFFTRREQYYWIVNQLGLKPATVLEFGKFNIKNVHLSKREIIPLVHNKVLTGFDDPRLYTIRGLKRRGFTPEILKNIILKAIANEMTRNESHITKGFIEHELRTVLDKEATRAFAVLDPLETIITNYIEKVCIRPDHPINEIMGHHKTKLTPTIYIERTDFREQDSSTYYRLAPKKTVRLRYADFIECESSDLANNKIYVKTNLPDKPKKIKGVIHWVNNNSHYALFEIYDDLYTDKDELVNNITLYKGFVENYVMEKINKNHNEIFQFERLGYFKLDRYSETGIPIFIRIIDLVDKYNKV